MKKALLVVGGDAPLKSAVEDRLSSYSFVCAADSGLEVAHRWALDPGLIVGDMDSLTNPKLLDEYPRAERVIVSHLKDETDTELGLRLLYEKGYDDVTVAGGGGGRLDHLLAIRSLFERPVRPREWWTARERVVVADTPFQADLPPGAVVSVFPLGRGARGMRSEGLRWALEGLAWGPGGFGVSNEATGGRVRIEPGEGELLVILPLAP